MLLGSRRSDRPLDAVLGDEEDARLAAETVRACR